MIVTISVTQEDIDLGDPCNCRACPIARAGERALGPCAVSGDTIRFFGYNGGKAIPLPDKARVFVDVVDGWWDGYDKSKLVPFSFDVEIEEPVVISEETHENPS